MVPIFGDPRELQNIRYYFWELAHRFHHPRTQRKGWRWEVLKDEWMRLFANHNICRKQRNRLECSLEVEVLIIPYLYSPSNLLAQVGVGKHNLTKAKSVPTQTLFSDIAKLADVNCPQNIFLASLKPWALHPSLASPKFIDTSRKELTLISTPVITTINQGTL